MRTHNLPARIFWHTVKLKTGTPLVHRSTATEYLYPYRESRVTIFRLPFRRGLVFGRWSPYSLDEVEAQYQALSGRPDDEAIKRIHERDDMHRETMQGYDPVNFHADESSGINHVYHIVTDNEDPALES